MTTDEELQKKLEATDEKLKEATEELKEEKEARKATEEEETEKKNEEARKATDEDMKKDDEEKTALKARIEILEKVPVVNEIVQSHLSAKLITSDKVSDFRAKLEKESITQLNARLETSKQFEAKMQNTSAATSVDIHYYGSAGVPDDDHSSFDASSTYKSDEQQMK